jgi:hypothetical protein
MRKHILTVVLPLAFLLHGCGGGDSTDVASNLRTLADQAEARALALAPTAVCTADTDCAFISFEDAFPSCTQHRDYPILATTPTRNQAEAAASSQRALASEARFAPGVQWDFACAAYVEPYPTPYCETGQCKLKPSLLAN